MTRKTGVREQGRTGNGKGKGPGLKPHANPKNKGKGKGQYGDSGLRLRSGQNDERERTHPTHAQSTRMNGAPEMGLWGPVAEVW